MADRFGGKWLFGGSVLLSSVVALLTPAAARIHIVLLIILRVLSGLGEGVMLPAIYAMIARWTVPKYYTLVANVVLLGMDVGIFAGMFVTGILCDYGFAGGWPSAFYVFGAFGCVCSAAWSLLCYNSPSDHPRISAVERKYWETVIGATELVVHPPTPWREILTSVPVWALAVAFFANTWGVGTLATCLPLFMNDVLGLDMTRNGIFSALPFAASLAAQPLSGLFADWLRSPGKLSTNAVRKIMCAVGFTLAGSFIILASYVGCNRALAVVNICIVVACSCVGFSCVAVNQLDLAPLHAGKIMGLTFTVANLASIAGPLAVGVLTSDGSRSEWQNVFYLTAGIYAVGAVVFVIFGSGHCQSWADEVELTLTGDRSKGS